MNNDGNVMNSSNSYNKKGEGKICGDSLSDDTMHDDDTMSRMSRKRSRKDVDDFVSVHGIKSDVITHSMDEDIISCLVQSELNLGRYNLYVRMASSTTMKKAEIKLSQRKVGDKKEVELLIHSRIRVVLPYPVDMERVHMIYSTTTNSKITTKLLRLPIRKRSRNNDILIDYETQREDKRSHVDSRELNRSVWRVLTVQCRQCGNVMVPPRLIRDVVRLPSPRWMELSGWCGGGGTEKPISTIINAQLGVCGVGRSRLLFHRSMFRPSAVVTVWQQEEEKKKKKKKKTELRCCGFTHDGIRGDVYCSRCQTILGFAIGSSNDNSSDITKTSDTGGVSLYKFRVVASRCRGVSEQTSNLFCRYGIGSILGPVLLESVRSRHRYRVNVVNASTKQCVLRIRVLSWSTELYISNSWYDQSSSLYKSLRRSDSSPCPVIRIAYETSSSSSSTSISAQTAQDLVFPVDICLQLITQLRSTTKLLPLDQRKCLGLSVGFVVW